MKCTIPEISWHNRDPVLSLDIQPVSNDHFYRLASGGTDSHVLIWHLIILDTGATTLEAVSDLTRHQRAVNVVRWSPSGQYLASGDDDASIIIWHQKADDLAVLLDGDTGDKEKWSVFKVLRGHKEDVYDICWSPDSTKLMSGSVDNTAIIWSVAKGNNETILTDHKGFVQGVTWDPLGQYVATLSSDRTFRVFNETGKKVISRMAKGCLPVPETHQLHKLDVRYYHDDTLKSFFRRLTFSPDGNLVITPTGCLEMGDSNKHLYTTYIYDVASLSQPVAILPSPSQYTVAARCCPILFELWSDGPDPIIGLPYRMIIAVATRSSVILYDTQQATPFAIISNIHYTRLTDMTWSHDGRLLAVSSTDGYCSLVTFEAGELGKQYVKESDVTVAPVPMEEPNLTPTEPMEISLNKSTDDKKEKRPSFLDQWAIKTPKSSTETIELQDEKMQLESEVKSTPAKPIAVRRKPRTIKTPKSSSETVVEIQQEPESIVNRRRKPRNTDQMNITTFLKTTKSVEDKVNPISFILEDSVAQDAWNSDKTHQHTKPTQMLSDNEPILIEDSQDIKLVIEDSTITVFKDINEEDAKPMLIDDCQDVQFVTEQSTITEFKDINEMQIKNMNESSNKQDLSTFHKVQRDLNKKIITEHSCPDTTPVHPNDLLNSKKRVPLITLSSPKHKKKSS